jgi:hypothetical protein
MLKTTVKVYVMFDLVEVLTVMVMTYMGTFRLKV